MLDTCPKTFSEVFQCLYIFGWRKRKTEWFVLQQNSTYWCYWAIHLNPRITDLTNWTIQTCSWRYRYTKFCSSNTNSLQLETLAEDPSASLLQLWSFAPIFVENSEFNFDCFYPGHTSLPVSGSLLGNPRFRMPWSFPLLPSPLLFLKIWPMHMIIQFM